MYIGPLVNVTWLIGRVVDAKQKEALCSYNQIGNHCDNSVSLVVVCDVIKVTVEVASTILFVYQRQSLLCASHHKLNETRLFQLCKTVIIVASVKVNYSIQ